MRSLGAAALATTLLVVTCVSIAAQDAGEPTTTDERLAGMVTEEVEPGVFRVFNDGVRDLGVDDAGVGGFVPAVDRSVWIRTKDGLVQLGQDRSVRFGKNGPRDGLVAAADGTFWSFNYRVLQHGPKGKRLRYLELGGCIGLAASPDGPVWVGTCLGPGYRLTRFDEDGRTVTEVPYAVPDNPEPRVTADGRVWVQGTKGRLYRYDGETWRKVKPPKGAEDTMVGGDGMLWSRGRTGTGAPVLFRFGGDTWQRWNVPDDGPDVIQRELRVTPDGRLLAFGAGPEGDDCAGVGVSHGDAWASFLQDHCVHDAVMGAEGRLWVQARPQGSGWLDPMEMHLILPG